MLLKKIVSVEEAFQFDRILGSEIPKIKMRIFIFLIITVIFITQCLPILASDDYFNRITMVSDGRITRFQNMPISVYISPPPVARELQNAYINDVEYALDQWAGCSEGQLQFKIVDSEKAYIRLYWGGESLSGEADPLGEASLVRFDSGSFYVKISIVLKERPSLNAIIHRNLRVVLMHEIGHAIGLWGHSPDPNDIMYPQSKAFYPTRRDKNTLLKLLSTPLDTAFHQVAIDELISDISSNPGKAYLHFWLGSVYADKGERDLAVKELLIALKLAPELVKVANRLGRIFQSEGMYDIAIDYYSKEAKQEPSAGIFGIIGFLYLRQEKYDKAIEYFKIALSMDSGFQAVKTDILAAYHLWAWNLIKNDKSSEAIPILSEALESFPTSRVLHYDIGVAYDKNGEYEKAIEEYKKALDIDPSFEIVKSDIANCINNLSAEQILNGNWEDSIELCEQSLKWDPSFWEARKNLESANLGIGMEKYKSGLMDEAITHYNTVIQINPKNINAYNGLGFAFYEKGMYEEALANFQAALNIDPEYDEAKLGVTASRKKININKAKKAILVTAISMSVFLFLVLIFRYRNHKQV